VAIDPVPHGYGSSVWSQSNLTLHGGREKTMKERPKMKNVMTIVFAVIVMMFIGSCSVKIQIKKPIDVFPSPVILTMWMDSQESSDIDCAQLRKQFYPRVRGNDELSSVISEAGRASYFAGKLVPVYEYIELDKMPKQYVMIFYFCDDVAKGKLTFVPNSTNPKDGVVVTMSEGDNPWTFYYQGFEELKQKSIQMLPPAPATTPEPAPTAPDPTTAPLPAKPKPPTAEEIEQARVACVAKINEFRKTLKLADLERDKVGEKCADDQVKKDQKSNKAHENAEMCVSTSTKYAQNTCPGYNGLADANGVCIQMMFDEGPPPTKRCTGECEKKHGHYINMTSKDYKKVACGFSVNENGEVWANHNFSN